MAAGASLDLSKTPSTSTWTISAPTTPDCSCPSAVQSYLDGRLNQMENRMASLLFKQAVELDMGLSMLFKCVNVSEEELRRQRAESVANVKKANGKVSLVQKLRELEDDPWQD